MKELKMTNNNLKIYYAIEQFLNKNKYSPTIQELCEMTNLTSKATVHTHLCNLKKLGLIDWENGKNRTLTLKKWIFY